MPLTSLDQATRNALHEYMGEVAHLSNESAKTHRFVALIQALFGSRAVAKFVPGVEKVVRIDTAGGSKKRRLDAYHGNAVIEFENSLKRSRSTAERQLREQCAGIWNEEGEPHRPLLAIASDGLAWQPFVPRVAKRNGRALRPDDVELIALDGISLEAGTLHTFWLWLASWLFRPAAVVPTTDQFQVDFGMRSPVYAEAMATLTEAWAEVGEQKHSRLSIETWVRYLTVTYGSLGKSGRTKQAVTAELTALFLKHTYLASVARLLVWAALSGGRGSGGGAELVDRVLSGAAFESLGIRNLVEDDFFQWVRRAPAARVLAPLWEGLLSQLRTYDLSRLNQDVLKGVYQELVDPQDRHDLGEYYTPEWLCERIVQEVLPRSGFHSVLDPTCGSGSFLRAAIAHMLRGTPSESPTVALDRVLNGVVGIDIHPLAVTIARATYALAVRSLIAGAKQPIQIPVYLADSLFLPAEVVQHRLGEAGGYDIRFGGDRHVMVPASLIKSAELFDAAIAASAKVAADHALTRTESRATLERYAVRLMSGLEDHPERADIIAALWLFTEELAELIRSERDSIWAFIVRNSYRPALLRGRFDYILGNPPWLSYRYIADPEYQAEVKRRATKQYKVAPRSQHLLTQMELATVFLLHALATFGTAQARLAFVMPRSVLSADQHSNLRTRRYVAPVRIDSYWDLFDVRPVFKVPSCVLFASRSPNLLPSESYSLPAVEWSGDLPERNLAWSEVETLISDRPTEARLIWLGGRNALSSAMGQVHRGKASRYADLFKDGATIYPRCFYFVAIKDRAENPIADRLYWVETDPEQAKQAKKPWDSVRLQGHVEGQFLFTAAIAKHLLPFAMLQPADVVLPLLLDQPGMAVAPAEKLKRLGLREMAAWMSNVEREWQRHRSARTTATAEEWLDYQGKLTSQPLRARHLVLYNASGTDLSAAHVGRVGAHARLVVDHKLYYCQCASADEADYLVAILNSTAVNRTIKPFQSRGLMGERDIHKKVLELPIPLFAGTDAVHTELAAVSREAAASAAEVIAASNFPRHLAAQRSAVRSAAANALTRIDALVLRLLAPRGN